MDSNREPVPTDVALEMIADPCRRQALMHLSSNGGEAVSIDDLVANIVAEKTPQAGHADSAERLSAQLHHVGLPKLDEAGIVDYDRERGTVRYSAHETVEELLHFVTDDGESIGRRRPDTR